MVRALFGRGSYNYAAVNLDLELINKATSLARLSVEEPPTWY